MCEIEQKLHNLRCQKFGVVFFEGGVEIVVSLPGHEFVKLEHKGTIDEALDMISFKLGIKNRSKKYRETNEENGKNREALRKDSQAVPRTGRGISRRSTRKPHIP